MSFRQERQRDEISGLFHVLSGGTIAQNAWERKLRFDGITRQLGQEIAPRLEEKEERFFELLAYCGPKLLTVPALAEKLQEKWYQTQHQNLPEGKAARKFFQRIGESLAWAGGSGRLEMSGKEKQRIVDDCLKWRTICEGMNGAFKKLWEYSEYESSERYRKEARGRLAEKYKISVEDVKRIERVLKTPSRQSRKSTPYTAMLEMVALSHVNRDEKTIENVFRE